MRIGIDARLIRSFGIGSYIRGLLGGLAALDGDDEYVVFITPDALDLVPERMTSISTTIPVYSLHEAFALGRLVARENLDLLHAPHFLVPWTATPIVCTLFDAIPFHYPLPNPIAAPYVAFMMQLAADRARRVITISHAAKHDLAGALDCAPEKIDAIPIGIDDALLDDREPRVEQRVEQRYFLFTGKAARHKNLETLLDAFARIHRKDQTLRLVLAGGGHERFSDRDGILTPGFVPQNKMAALYRGALAVVMPSFMEGFGLPPLEGMAVGTPAITSTAPALVEVTGDAALHVDPHDPEALADAMDRVAHDEPLRASLSKAGRERARTFTWRRCAEATRDVYYRVTDKDRAP